MVKAFFKIFSIVKSYMLLLFCTISWSMIESMMIKFEIGESIAKVGWGKSSIYNARSPVNETNANPPRWIFVGEVFAFVFSLDR
jgi:hypothetical protein